MPRTERSLAVIASFVLSASMAIAQESGLPGNASNLREGHGDWQVTCAPAEGVVKCAMSQIQLAENRQRVLSIELTSGDDGATASGALVLPFGLDLSSGVAHRVDEGKMGTVRPFRTCLPVGCLVDVAFDAVAVASLRAGNQLNVVATADGGQEVIFSVSLAGFTSAYNRVIALMR